MDLFDLSGKVAPVTGASRGLGLSMAKGLEKAGASVAVGDVLDTTEADQELNRQTEKVLGLEVDVSDRTAVQDMIETIREELEGLDILVNNAGIFRPSPAEVISEDKWDEVIEVNLKGKYTCAQEAGEVMIEQNSEKIINIASVAGLRAFSESASYNASKGSVVMLTKSLATEWESTTYRSTRSVRDPSRLQ